MIVLNIEYVKEYIKRFMYDAVQHAYENEFNLIIEDVDDIHDCSIESEEIERVYFALYAMLPMIFDEVVDYVNDIDDFDEDVWGTYAMREGIGLCD